MADILTVFPLKFNSSIRIEARPERLTTDPGALVLRETLERLGTIPWLIERLQDPRDPRMLTHPLTELLRTELIRLGQGWRDHDDADALRDDAVMRLAVSDRRGISPLKTRPDEERLKNHNPVFADGLASQPTLSRLARMLSSESNRKFLRASLLETVAARIRTEHRGHRLREVTLDIDSLPIEVHGHQPGSEYNGHYHARIYHPLIASIAETGDMIDGQLREGAVHTANGAREFTLPLLDQVERKLAVRAAVRIDAGFPEEKLLADLEARGTRYVARVRNNPVLDRMAEPHLHRPPGRRPAEPREWFYESTYQAETWSRPRRVVLVVQERADELFLHHFWLITNRSIDEMSGPDLRDWYRKRGAAEMYMGEVMNVLDPALSSSPRPKSHYRGETPARRYASGNSFAINEALLLLNLLAYDIVHVTRLTMEKATGEGWSLQRLRERVLRVAARILVHERRATVVLAQAAAKLWQLLLLDLAFLRGVATSADLPTAPS